MNLIKILEIWIVKFSLTFAISVIVFLICRLNSIDVFYWASQIGNWIVMIDWLILIDIDWLIFFKEKEIDITVLSLWWPLCVICSKCICVVLHILHIYCNWLCSSVWHEEKKNILWCSICFLHWSIDLMFSALDPLKLIKFLTAYQINSNHALVLQMRRIELIPGQRGWLVGTSMQTHGQWPRRIT